jgi:hypothetical protein
MNMMVSATAIGSDPGGQGLGRIAGPKASRLGRTIYGNAAGASGRAKTLQ